MSLTIDNASPTAATPVTDDTTQPRSAIPSELTARAAVRPGPPHPVWWIIAGSLAVIALALVTRPAGVTPPALGGVALGQTTAGGARGVFAFSGQLTKSTYGVYVVDVDTMTMWAYEYQPQKECLRLAAARTWRYDRYLENHNICDLPPEAVEEMVEQQRQYRLDRAESRMPPK